MKNVSELRDHLSEVFGNLEKGQIQPKDATALASLAGKMIASAKVQLDYHAMRKETTQKISFLHSLDT